MKDSKTVSFSGGGGTTESGASLGEEGHRGRVLRSSFLAWPLPVAALLCFLSAVMGAASPRPPSHDGPKLWESSQAHLSGFQVISARFSAPATRKLGDRQETDWRTRAPLGLSTVTSTCKDLLNSMGFSPLPHLSSKLAGYRRCKPEGWPSLRGRLGSCSKFRGVGTICW